MESSGLHIWVIGNDDDIESEEGEKLKSEIHPDFSQETPYNIADSGDDVSLKSEKELMQKKIQNKLSLGIQQIVQRPRRNYSARPYREYVSRRSAEFETKPEQNSGFGWPLLNWF